MGWMGDRLSKPLLCAAALLPTLVALLSLAFSEASAVIYFLPVGLSITMGTMPLNWAIIGDFFGRRSYATLRGIMGIFYGVATFGSPIYAGWVFDLTASYTITLLTFAAASALAAIFFALLRPPVPARFAS
jgi:MFS family permease